MKLHPPAGGQIEEPVEPADGLKGLFMLHQAELGRFMKARCGEDVEAEDLIQELWIKLANLNPGPISNGRAYLFRMANNLVLDQRRSKHRAMARDRQWSEAGGEFEVNPLDRADPALNAEEAICRDQEVEALRTAIAGLPARSQTALRHYRLEGLGQSEIAKQMGISRSGVEKHLAAAMRHLRIALEECGILQSATSFDQGTENKELSEMEKRS